MFSSAVWDFFIKRLQNNVSFKRYLLMFLKKSCSAERGENSNLKAPQYASAKFIGLASVADNTLHHNQHHADKLPHAAD